MKNLEGRVREGNTLLLWSPWSNPAWSDGGYIVTPPWSNDGTSRYLIRRFTSKSVGSN